MLENKNCAINEQEKTSKEEIQKEKVVLVKNKLYFVYRELNLKIFELESYQSP